jgi:nicotinate-nucleotide adenylyltransferase
MSRPVAKSNKKKAPPLRLGIYGGTFDPVHNGHLLLARDALEQAKLDAVLFVPCGQSPLKSAKPQATDRQRLALLRLALKLEPCFWLTRCEIDRPAPSYAIDTVSEIREAFPRAKLFWMIGADQLADLPKWHREAELRQRVTFLLLPRGEVKESDPKVLSLSRPRRIDISATEIRHRVKSRLPIDLLVPKPVAAYIKRHRLYLS